MEWMTGSDPKIAGIFLAMVKNQQISPDAYLCLAYFDDKSGKWYAFDPHTCQPDCVDTSKLLPGEMKAWMKCPEPPKEEN